MKNHYKFWIVFSFLMVFAAGIFSGIILEKHILDKKSPRQTDRGSRGQRRGPVVGVAGHTKPHRGGQHVVWPPRSSGAQATRFLQRRDQLKPAWYSCRLLPPSPAPRRAAIPLAAATAAAMVVM